LNRFLSNAGIAARRDADKLIQAGLVKINGETVTELGVKVKPSDEIIYNGKKIVQENKAYVLLNKPKDYITTMEDPEDRKTVMDLLKNATSERIYPVGRLDRNTTGVLLLTNDGDLAQKLTHPRYGVKKVYIATLDKTFKPMDLRQLANGVDLEDGFMQPDSVQYVSENDKKVVFIEIHSGRNRIVHRLFESLGYLVERLDRTSYAGLTKTGLKKGEHRFLTDKEVNLLRRL
jgi:23S rRNA pseudouridine2605 synthase